MKSENRQVRASLFRSVCAVVMSMLMVVSMMPTMALTAHAEEGDMILIGASWHDTKAGWDRIDGASYYMVQAFFISYDPGETISSDPVKVNQAYTSVSYDFDEFFEANGSGKYSFSVKAYNEGNELIASGESAKKDFYHVQINMTSLDIDGETELEVEKGGRLMFSVDGGGESTEESTSYYREAGEGETEVSAYSTDGFELFNMTVNGETITNRTHTFNFAQDTVINVTFKKTAETKQIKVDLGNAEVAAEVLKKIHGEGDYSSDLDDAEATLEGNVITLKVLASYTEHDVVNALNDIAYDTYGLEGYEDSKGNKMFSEFGRKPIEQYKDEDEYMEELETNHNVQVTDGQTFYAFWFKFIKSIDITVKAPVCGTEVTTTESDEMSGGRPVVSQTGAPEFTVPEHITKSELMGQDSYLVASVPERPVNMEFFNGKIEGEKEYLVMLGINYDFGYFFTDATVVKVNGAAPEKVFDAGGKLIFAKVKAEHNWDAWKVTKKASDKALGSAVRTCKGDKSHKETKVIAKVKLGKPAIGSVGIFSKKQLIVSWKKVKGATSYKVSYRKVGAKKWTTKTTTKTKYTIKKLKVKGMYQVKVAAVKKETAETVKVIGKDSNGNYRYMRSVKGTKVKAGKGKLIVKWKRDPKATGYRVLYSTGKEKSIIMLKNPKTVTVDGGKKVKAVIKGLKSGKTYYVRVRPVRKYKGATYIGVLGKLEKAKTK